MATNNIRGHIDSAHNDIIKAMGKSAGADPFIKPLWRTLAEAIKYEVKESNFSTERPSGKGSDFLG